MITLKKGIKKFYRRVYKNIKKPEMRILPGQLAFFFLLSLVPLAALIASIISNFSISIETLMEVISETLPSEVANFINGAIGGKSINFNITIFYISAFILASNGPHSMIIGSNLIYKVDNKDFLSRRIKAILMTVILVLLLIFLLLVPAYGDMLIVLITDVIDNDTINKSITNSYGILKYPLSFLLIFFFIKLLYTMAPDKTIKSKDTTYGAMFTSISWIISTELYSFYVSTFAKYNLLYGSIANLLILLLWVYLLAYIFVLGMALNASYEDSENNKKESE